MSHRQRKEGNMTLVRSVIGYVSTVVFAIAVAGAAVAFVTLVARWTLDGGL